MTKTLLWLPLLAAAFVALFFVQNASATPITVDYTGVITSVGDFQASHFFTVNDAFSGSFTFDSDLPTPFGGATRELNALTWATSYYSVSLTPSASNAAFITDPAAPDRGVTGAGGFITGAPVAWNGPTNLAIPSSLNIDSLPGLQMRLLFDTILGQFEVDGALTSFTVRQPTAVPEPATLFLLGTGLIGTAVGSRRRARR